MLTRPKHSPLLLKSLLFACCVIFVSTSPFSGRSSGDGKANHSFFASFSFLVVRGQLHPGDSSLPRTSRGVHTPGDVHPGVIQPDASSSSQPSSSSASFIEMRRLGIAWVSDVHLDPYYSATASTSTYCREKPPPADDRKTEEQKREKEKGKRSEETSKKTVREGVVNGHDDVPEKERKERKTFNEENLKAKEEKQNERQTKEQEKAGTQNHHRRMNFSKVRRNEQLTDESRPSTISKKESSYLSASSSSSLLSLSHALYSTNSSTSLQGESREGEDEDLFLYSHSTWMAEETYPYIGRGGCDSSPLLTEIVLDDILSKVVESRRGRGVESRRDEKAGEERRKKKREERVMGNGRNERLSGRKDSPGEERSKREKVLKLKSEKAPQTEEKREINSRFSSSSSSLSSFKTRRDHEDFSVRAMHARELSTLGRGREKEEKERQGEIARETPLLRRRLEGVEDSENQPQRTDKEKREEVVGKGPKESPEREASAQEEDEEELLNDAEGKEEDESYADDGEEEVQRGEDEDEESIARPRQSTSPPIDTLLLTGDFAAHYGDFQPEKRFLALRLVTKALLSRFTPVQPSPSVFSSFDRFAEKREEGDNDGRAGGRRGRDGDEKKEAKTDGGNQETSVNTGRDNRGAHSDDASIHPESSQDDDDGDRVSIQLIVSVGNNDLPTDYHIPDTFNQWSSDLYSLWRRILPSDKETKETFTRGLYYRTWLRNSGGKLRVLSLNTNFYSKLTRQKLLSRRKTKTFQQEENEEEEEERWRRRGYGIDDDPQNLLTGSDPAGQFAWMQRELESARESGEKVLIVGHIPPGVTLHFGLGLKHTHQWDDIFFERYREIVLQYPDVILAHLYGHIHADTARILTGFLSPPPHNDLRSSGSSSSFFSTSTQFASSHHSQEISSASSPSSSFLPSSSFFSLLHPTSSFLGRREQEELMCNPSVASYFPSPSSSSSPLLVFQPVLTAPAVSPVHGNNPAWRVLHISEEKKAGSISPSPGKDIPSSFSSSSSLASEEEPPYFLLRDYIQFYLPLYGFVTDTQASLSSSASSSFLSEKKEEPLHSLSPSTSVVDLSDKNGDFSPSLALDSKALTQEREAGGENKKKRRKEGERDRKRSLLGEDVYQTQRKKGEGHLSFSSSSSSVVAFDEGRGRRSYRDHHRGEEDFFRYEYQFSHTYSLSCLSGVSVFYFLSLLSSSPFIYSLYEWHVQSGGKLVPNRVRQCEALVSTKRDYLRCLLRLRRQASTY